MDFDKAYMEKHQYGKYESIDPAHLPRLFLAYKTQLGKVSGKVLNTIKQRYDAGDEEVITTLNEIAGLAHQGKEAIINHEYDLLSDIINRNFDLRCKIMQISESNLEMVKTARSCGASAKFSGSGGAIIGMYRDDEMLRKLILALNKINARVIKPYIL
jgi:glucuronokinase